MIAQAGGAVMIAQAGGAIMIQIARLGVPL